jgi:hypothetical protein
MRYWLIVLLLAWGAGPAFAEEAPSETRLDLATELLELLDVERSMLGGATAMADAMIAQNPMLTPYRSVLLEWSRKHLTWESLQPRFAEMYAEAYTEKELRDLIAFYRTPTGRKAVEVGPDLMQRGAMVGNEVAQENMPELERMIEARTAELEALGQGSP